MLSLLPYLIPCMGAIAFTDQAFMTYPTTFMVAVAISPLLQIFYSNSFIPFVTFFTLFLAVVRNTKLNHFLRYNTMQAILLDICVMLAGLIMQYLPMFLTVSLLGDWLELFTLVNALFAIGYCALERHPGAVPGDSPSSPRRCTRRSGTSEARSKRGERERVRARTVIGVVTKTKRPRQRSFTPPTIPYTLVSLLRRERLPRTLR